MTEHLEQIVVVPVVTAIKDSHVTRGRACVLRDVTQDTMGSTATNVKYMFTSIEVLFYKELNEIFLARLSNIFICQLTIYIFFLSKLFFWSVFE